MQSLTSMYIVRLEEVENHVLCDFQMLCDHMRAELVVSFARSEAQRTVIVLVSSRIVSAVRTYFGALAAQQFPVVDNQQSFVVPR